jgi:hypothetical protein
VKGLKALDTLAQLHFDYAAQLALHKKTATAYQDHFNDLMEAAHGTDFIRVRPAGSRGDDKCDGYLQRTHTVFQVYAPTTVRIARWVAKANEDFDGALAQWKSMRGWTFVHNQHDGLPPGVAKAILDIKTANPTLTIEHWPPTQILELSRRLTEVQLIALFGSPPREEDMRALDRGDIARAVTGLTHELADWRPGTELPNVDRRKLDYNQLSEYPRRLITAGIAQSSLVQGYFDNNPDPNLRDRAAARVTQAWRNFQTTATPDGAFDQLYQLVSEHAQGPRGMTAALAMLAHLFEVCDIFENPPPDWGGGQ